ncbi:hypothetical protein K2173_023137 [Erythroxylum novogranatense]|uniref:Peptidase S54 rhomboid domain-containing protein n=1 Tax=Erythroxylum novogranatense TaxID=1862640 RepID=A0AAV8U7Q7_9ROSI|nr:hypothetical protein K2173_023137 [Erythroxylum novogranatense]
MSLVLMCYKMPYKDCCLRSQNAISQHRRQLQCDCSIFSTGSRYLDKKWQALLTGSDILAKSVRRGRVHTAQEMNLGQGDFLLQNINDTPSLHKGWSKKGYQLCKVPCALNGGNTEAQLKLLDSYLGKLHGAECQPSSDADDQRVQLLEKTDLICTREELDSLNTYLGKLNENTNTENYKSSNFDNVTQETAVAKPFTFNKGFRKGDPKISRSTAELRQMKVDSGSGRSQSSEKYDETSDLYVASILASVNIAVFLFEMASPIRESHSELFSLPLLYGAKINDLILVGEWWRLVTPMFLHSGICHMALGCWSLLSFGPQVCRAYGSFTFFLIYLLGGISGNLTSFLHTPEATVGGTGPVFAVIGAWLIYQRQNKDVIAKDTSERMFQKALITTALSCILSNFGPIDDWTHLGAAFTGIVYGFFTCPTLQLDETSSRRSQDEGIALVRRYADPCKSLLVFTICVLFLSSLLLLVEPPLDTVDDLAL